MTTPAISASGYAPLGSYQATAIADGTGLNTGNYTATFNSMNMPINVPFFEVYHAYTSTSSSVSFTGGGSLFEVWVNRRPWDNVPYSANNGWDPSQPMLLRPSDEVDFFFNIASSNQSAPLVTLWLRYNIIFTNGVPVSA